MAKGGLRFKKLYLKQRFKSHLLLINILLENGPYLFMCQFLTPQGGLHFSCVDSQNICAFRAIRGEVPDWIMKPGPTEGQFFANICCPEFSLHPSFSSPFPAPGSCSRSKLVYQFSQWEKLGYWVTCFTCQWPSSVAWASQAPSTFPWAVPLGPWTHSYRKWYRKGAVSCLYFFPSELWPQINNLSCESTSFRTIMQKRQLVFVECAKCYADIIFF